MFFSLPQFMRTSRANSTTQELAVEEPEEPRSLAILDERGRRFELRWLHSSRYEVTFPPDYPEDRRDKLHRDVARSLSKPGHIGLRKLTGLNMSGNVIGYDVRRSKRIIYTVTLSNIDQLTGKHLCVSYAVRLATDDYTIRSHKTEVFIVVTGVRYPPHRR